MIQNLEAIREKINKVDFIRNIKNFPWPQNLKGKMKKCENICSLYHGQRVDMPRL